MTPKLIDVKVSREDWFLLANRGVYARIAGPTPEEMQALVQDVLASGLAIRQDGERIDPADFYLPPEA